MEEDDDEDILDEDADEWTPHGTRKARKDFKKKTTTPSKRKPVASSTDPKVMKQNDPLV